MKLVAIALSIALIGLAGCTSPEDQARQDAAYCREAEKIFARDVNDSAVAGRNFFVQCLVNRTGGTGARP